MKLSEATNEQKTIALAELDGWVKIHCGDTQFPSFLLGVKPGSKERPPFDHERLPNYLTRYDAIIPLVQKCLQTTEQRHTFSAILHTIIAQYNTAHPGYVAAFDFYMRATPTQLADALLIVTGKFES